MRQTCSHKHSLLILNHKTLTIPDENNRFWLVIVEASDDVLQFMIYDDNPICESGNKPNLNKFSFVNVALFVMLHESKIKCILLDFFQVKLKL